MRYIIIFYLVLIHLLIGISILKTDIISKIQTKLGIERVEDELTSYFYTLFSFQQRVDKNTPNNTVHFIGDSLIQGLAVSAVFPQSVNFGIGQDTTVGVLTRLPFYTSISRSKLVVIAIGINDLKLRKNDEIIKKYQEIIEAIPKTVPLLFSAILPVNEIAGKRTDDNDRIKTINEALKEICLGNNRLYFIDISKSLVDSKGDLSSQFHRGDGIHLNHLGNDIWIYQLKLAVLTITSQDKGS